MGELVNKYLRSPNILLYEIRNNKIIVSMKVSNSSLNKHIVDWRESENGLKLIEGVLINQTEVFDDGISRKVF